MNENPYIRNHFVHVYNLIRLPNFGLIKNRARQIWQQTDLQHAFQSPWFQRINIDKYSGFNNSLLRPVVILFELARFFHVLHFFILVYVGVRLNWYTYRLVFVKMIPAFSSWICRYLWGDWKNDLRFWRFIDYSMPLGSFKTEML